jgi:lysophospholipase L1-like esterase
VRTFRGSVVAWLAWLPLVLGVAGCNADAAPSPSAAGAVVDGGAGDASNGGGAGDASVASNAAASDAGAASDGPGGSSGKTRVAFIGDSITAGVGASTAASQWVTLVEASLGPDFAVGNFGVSGATMMKVSDDPYWSSGGLANVATFLAGTDPGQRAMVVIMLGTNDSKDDVAGVDNWTSTAPQRFHDDYGAMIDQLQASRPAPQIFLAAPPPAYSYDDDIDPGVIAQQIAPLVEQLAAERRLPLVPVFAALSDQDAGGAFPDGIHPDDDGQALLAAIMYHALTSPQVPPLPDGG